MNPIPFWAVVNL
uniref:Uncharacterized protein n=1 Tax=Rhizophora mucronata TaxID=61149 RepID=A0A2P2NRL9_RHIMU